MWQIVAAADKQIKTLFYDVFLQYKPDSIDYFASQVKYQYFAAEEESAQLQQAIYM